MRIGILIPDRNDRPEFLKNCLRMMEMQSLQPSEIEIVNDPARNNDIDIGWRYKTGYARLQNRGLDLIAFIENDDWYHPLYLETLANKWEQSGKPMLIGTSYTIYYHLKLKKYFTFNHLNRASAMNTAIRPNIPKIDWGPEHDPYTDMHLWTKVGYKEGDRIIFIPSQHLSVGMKHNTGKVGGFCHNDNFERYVNEDDGFLEQTIKGIDPEGYQFYTNIQL